MTTTWEIFVRDATNARVAQVVDFADAEFTFRYNQVGAWRFAMQASDERALLLAANGAGVELHRDGVCVFSGPVTSRERSFSTTADLFVFAGADDLEFLRRRVAHPEPSTLPPGPYSTSEHDVRTGPVETVIKGYVAYNCGASARSTPVPRLTPNLTVATDLGRGPTATGRARWGNLLDFCRDLANYGGLGLRCIRYEFDVFDPTETGIVFDPDFSNLASYSYRDAAPETNYVYGLGGGQGTARITREAGDSLKVADWGLIETIRDRRDTEDVNEIEQSIVEVLADLEKSATGVQVVPIDGITCSWKVDYDIGSLVSVNVDGVLFSERVSEVKLKLSPEGPQIELAIGALMPDITTLFIRLAALARQVRHLQTSQ